MHEFKAETSTPDSRGAVYVVRDPFDGGDFSHLVGQEVKIDGVVHRVAGVERCEYMPPWYVGEGISLLVASALTVDAEVPQPMPAARLGLTP